MLVRLTALLLSPSRTVLFLAGFHLLLRLGTSRIYEQQRLESPAEMADLGGLETGLQNGAQGIAVPMAIAHAADREWHERILYPGGDASLRAHMFEEQQGTPWLEHPPDLAQTTLRILHGTENEGGHGTLELRIGEWEGLDRDTGERDGNGSCRARAPGLHQHRLVRLDRLHSHNAGRIVEGEILASTSTHFQHDPACLADSLTPQGIEHPPDQRPPHHPVVKCGKTWGGDVLCAWSVSHIAAHCILSSCGDKVCRSTTFTWKWFPGTGVGCSSMTS